MYTLVSLPGTCSTGINVLLNELNIDAEIVSRDEVPNYQQKVPTNQVPALIDGEKTLTEGAAIILYLFEKHNVNIADYGNPAEFRQWLMFNYATLHPAYGQMFTANGVMEDSEHKSAYLSTLSEKVAEKWKIVDDRLAKQPYMAGEKVSVLDYLLAIYVSWGNYFPDHTIALGDNVKRLVNDVTQHAVFKDAYAREGVEFAFPQSV